MGMPVTERERQAVTMPGYGWIVVSHAPLGVTVTCLAPTESGAYRVAEAEHPGVQWAYATRRECRCDEHQPSQICRYGFDICAACGHSTQNIDTGSMPTGERLCGFDFRLSLGRTFAEVRAAAQIRIYSIWGGKQ